MRPWIGAPVWGEDLWGREAFIRRVWQALEANSVLLVAPRRFGKTSVMHALCEEPRGTWKCVYLNAEYTTTPVAFAVQLIHAAWEALPSWRTTFTKRLEQAKQWARASIAALGVATSPDQGFWLDLRRDMEREWQLRSLDLLQTLRGADARVVFAIDELAVMLEAFRDYGTSEADTRSFLHWFRHLRTDPGEGLRNCRFVLGSSIGVEGALSRIGAIDTINDLQPIVLLELAPADAKALLARLLDDAGLRVSPAAQKAALDAIGPGVPFFIQIMADALIAAAWAGEKVGPRGVRLVYERDVLGTHSRTYFEHYYDRLRRYDPVDHDLALALLRHLAEVQRAATSTLWAIYARRARDRRSHDDFRRMLADLETDFYIRADAATGEHVFWSNILRDWWRRYYGMEDGHSTHTRGPRVPREG
ncbi:MAG: hypothetical protein FJX75_20690 [Armatimonadetes bacterium]|nr:hypothetical protein [Armatimonadota bacterium]